MSKWQLPIQEGTGLFGRTTRQPVAVRVYGAKGDEDARRLVGALQSPIDHFYLSQTSQRSLSNLNIYKSSSAPIEGLRLTYTYNHGLEYLDVTVSETLSKQVLQETKEDYWTWVLLDVDVPDTQHSDGVVGAVFKSLRIDPPPRETGLQFAGAAYSAGQNSAGILYFSDGLNPFVLSYAPTTSPFRTLTRGVGATLRASLLIDLRRYPKVPFIVDVFGDLQMGSTTGIYAYHRHGPADHITTTYTNLGAVAYPSGWPYDVAGKVPDFDNLGFLVDISDNTNAPLTAYVSHGSTLTLPSEVYIPAPTIVSHTDAGTAGLWFDGVTYDATSNLLNGITEYTYYEHFDPTTNTSSTNSFLGTSVWTWDITPITGTIPANPETRLCPVRGIGGFGWPNWGQTLFSAPQMNFAEWDIQSMTTHLPTNLLATVTVDTNTYKKLGRLAIDPVHKSLAFKPV